MYRASTPTHVFEIPFDASILSNALITYTQCGNVVLEKRLADCVVEGNKLIVRLTQKETNKFKCNRIVEIQLRVLSAAGEALVSDIFNEPCGRVLNDEVLE